MAKVSIGEAASTLNVSIDTIRRRVRSGAISASRDSRGQWWLELPDTTPEPRKPSVDDRIAVGLGTPLQASSPDADLVAQLRDEIAALRARLDASEAERREDKAQAAAERDRLWSLVEKAIEKK
ncbi:MAG: hypothetical protein ACM3YM_12240 [Sphingomonadales bacterium]